MTTSHADPARTKEQTMNAHPTLLHVGDAAPTLDLQNQDGGTPSLAQQRRARLRADLDV